MAVAGVVCAGNLVYDILARPVEGIRWDATVWVDTIEEGMGGNGSNTSYAIARLGVAVRLAGWLGEDPYGAFIRSKLSAAGVDITFVQPSKEPTPVTIALVRGDGSRAFIHRPGCSLTAFAQPLEFNNALIEGASYFHLANIFGLPHMRVNAAETLARARRAGLRTSLDTGWDARGEWAKVVDPCLPHLDYLFVNRDEAEHLSGAKEIRKAASLFRSRGAGTVVIKLGAEGCHLESDGISRRVAGFAVAAVDSTGAGDCFAGAFLAGLCHGMDLPAAARLANAAGALSVQRVGAVTGLLNLEQTLRWMEAAAPGR